MIAYLTNILCTVYWETAKNKLWLICFVSVETLKKQLERHITWFLLVGRAIYFKERTSQINNEQQNQRTSYSSKWKSKSKVGWNGSYSQGMFSVSFTKRIYEDLFSWYPEVLLNIYSEISSRSGWTGNLPKYFVIVIILIEIKFILY